jgi:hypothetical protein
MRTRAGTTALALVLCLVGATAFLVVQDFAGTLPALGVLIVLVTGGAWLSYPRS